MKFLKGTLAIDKLSSLFFRMAAMGSKFVVFTYLSKYFDTDTYGVYSLQATTVTIAIFILGLDFYNYTIRDILIKNEDTAAKVFTSFILYILIYGFFSILGYAIFSHVDYFAAFAWLLVIISITEHLNQEIYRLLLAFKNVWIANFLLFVRVAGWSLYVLLQTMLLDNQMGIRDVLMVWVFFNLGTLLLTLVFFAKPISSAILLLKFKKSWMLQGLKVSMIFYAATIFLKIIEYSNRYIVEGILGEAAAGIFSFYSNFAMVIGIYVSTIVVSYELPDLIESSTTIDFKSKLKRFKKLLLQHTAFISAAILIAMYPILLWQGKTAFIDYWPLMLLLIFGAFLMNVSLIYHSYLYIMHREKKLLEIVMISGIINLISTFILCKFYGLYGTGVAFIITAALLFYLRKVAATKTEKI